MEFERLNFPQQTFLPMIHKVSFSGKELDPLEMFSKLSENKPYAFILESCYKPSPISRYSIIGSDPFLIFRSVGQEIELVREDRRDRLKGEPMELLKRILKAYRVLYAGSLPPFLTGGVGFFSYDLVHQFEELPKTTRDDLECPDIYLMFVDHAVVIDHVDRNVFIMNLVGSEEDVVKNLHEARVRVGETLEIVEGCIRKKKGQDRTWKLPAKPSGKLNVRSNLSRKAYEDMVKSAQKLIKKGDIYQANLSQRFTARFDLPGVNLYSNLRSINPSPFGGYLRFEDMEIVSSSPERLLKVEDNRIVTRPIAGTRPRGQTPEKDKELQAELLLSEKERAEHLMLVDLERNDVGRVSRPGTVKVDQLMTIEDYSHVKHIVSNISGELDDRYEPLDALAALFPGGTITGVPKIRCMQVIDQLESHRRGPYTGSMGYLSFNGSLDLNIVIRTVLLKNGRAYFQAGGGVVYDSDPQAEYQESVEKAQALREALRVTVEGLRPTASMAAGTRALPEALVFIDGRLVRADRAPRLGVRARVPVRGLRLRDPAHPSGKPDVLRRSSGPARGVMPAPADGPARHRPHPAGGPASPSTDRVGRGLGPHHGDPRGRPPAPRSDPLRSGAAHRLRAALSASPPFPLPKGRPRHHRLVP